MKNKNKQSKDSKQDRHIQHFHYYSEFQQGAAVKKEIKAILLGNEFVFKTAAGVFSKKKVDKGTRILIENCIIKKEWKVLDLGSGIGIVGIAVAKKYDCDIVMTEINKRACALAKENVLLNNLKDKIAVFQGNMFEPLDKGRKEKEEKHFDTILLNPPQTAGKKICLEMIDKAFSHLSQKGLLQLVARHNKGGKTLSKYMEEVFGNVKEIAKKSGYRVYVSQV